MRASVWQRQENRRAISSISVNTTGMAEPPLDTDSARTRLPGLFSLYHIALGFVQHSESFSGVERYSLCSFNSRELVTTETELNAIAVPASTGLNSPNAARGTPMVL